MKKHPTLPLWATEDGKIYGPKGIRSLQFDRYGYLRLSCQGPNGHMKAYVHRVVAEAFLGLMDGMTVNHKDGDKTNNSITNLEFMSASENTSHSFKSGNRKSCCHPVEFDGVFYYSKREFERKTGIPRKTKIGEMQCR